MSPRFASVLAAFAAGVIPFAAVPASGAMPPNRESDHDCAVFEANDEAIGNGLDTVNDLVAGYFTYDPAGRTFGHDQYPDFETDELNALLSTTLDTARRADQTRQALQTRPAILALQRIADDLRTVHDTAVQYSKGEITPRTVGFAKDVLFKSVDNYNEAHGYACGMRTSVPDVGLIPPG